MPSALQNLCAALESVVAPLGPTADELERLAAHLREHATAVQQAAGRAGVPAGPVVAALADGAARAHAAADGLRGMVSAAREYVDRTAHGTIASTAAGSQDQAVTPGWPGSAYGLVPSPTRNGGVNLLPADDEAGRRGALVDGVEGFTDVVVHGNEHAVGLHDGPPVSAAQFAEVIRATPGLDGPLRLMACSTGKLDEGFAQELADALGVPVLAPVDIVHLPLRGDGTVQTVVGPTTFLPSPHPWRVFTPKE